MFFVGAMYFNYREQGGVSDAPLAVHGSVVRIVVTPQFGFTQITLQKRVFYELCKPFFALIMMYTVMA